MPERENHCHHGTGEKWAARSGSDGRTLWTVNSAVPFLSGEAAGQWSVVGTQSCRDGSLTVRHLARTLSAAFPGADAGDYSPGVSSVAACSLVPPWAEVAAHAVHA
ncbi:hypothetical protein SKAU_G00104060 [Synaphobranchus kaupii]|uniref:Uncharacterized protein n=1 Tax=Synaphobranchus kaupii TaxID=118154 RepID=A0A9Q1FZY0_SYNKA|nr:hypothetical protein SKAU_G00104060 [Synaphobranchus kaupii]